ncbi:hypothetical protein QJS10_CPB19g01631 [Acorus calamus]|uniref:WRC domain-containing protein n=1 Tax=Acorus calamus TaxID=4465 RepID=A0AAV9CEN7_ACOCL|nr:hypothetical protein QJS10_CPB19g01631 [Acorus calamus]
MFHSSQHSFPLFFISCRLGGTLSSSSLIHFFHFCGSHVDRFSQFWVIRREKISRGFASPHKSSTMSAPFPSLRKRSRKGKPSRAPLGHLEGLDLSPPRDEEIRDDKGIPEDSLLPTKESKIEGIDEEGEITYDEKHNRGERDFSEGSVTKFMEPSSTSKSCTTTTEKGDVNTNGHGSTEEAKKDVVKEKKRRGRPSAVKEEGFGCKRNSGTGWRCGKATVDGFNFCAYHLEKMRMRKFIR